MSVLNGNILGKPSGGGAKDGDGDGNPEALEFSLGGVTTSLIGGRKTTDAGAALDTLGVDSITITSGIASSSQVASGLRSIVIGHNVVAAGPDGIAIGSGADVSGNGSSNIAIGDLATAGGSNNGNIAIGQQADCAGIGQDNIAMGRTANNASGSHNIAIGAGSDTNGSDQVAIGCFANCAASDAVAIGQRSDATGIGSIAIGGDGVTGAQATAVGAIAIGGDDANNTAANASGINSIALGSGSSVDTDNSLGVTATPIVRASGVASEWFSLNALTDGISTEDIPAETATSYTDTAPTNTNFHCTGVTLIISVVLDGTVNIDVGDSGDTTRYANLTDAFGGATAVGVGVHIPLPATSDATGVTVPQVTVIAGGTVTEGDFKVVFHGFLRRLN